MCRYKELVDGSLDLVDIARMHVLIDAREAHAKASTASGDEAKKTPPKKRRRYRTAKRSTVIDAIAELYPNGIPKKALTKITIDINEWLEKKRLPRVGEETVGRALDDLRIP